MLGGLASSACLLPSPRKVTTVTPALLGCSAASHPGRLESHGTVPDHVLDEVLLSDVLDGVLLSDVLDGVLLSDVLDEVLLSDVLDGVLLSDVVGDGLLFSGHSSTSLVHPSCAPGCSGPVSVDLSPGGGDAAVGWGGRSKLLLAGTGARRPSRRLLLLGVWGGLPRHVQVKDGQSPAVW